MAVLGQKGGDTGLPNIQFAATSTWTPECNIEAIVYCIGGGGTGGQSNEDANYSCSGGGAGGTAVSRYTFLASTAYTITIGAGGTAAGTTSQEAIAGNAGNASTIAVGGSTFMTGGAGGAGAIGSGAGCSGGSGGSGSGGNLANYDGGDGGACGATKTASGGGAVGLWEDGNDGQAGIDVEGSGDDISVSFGGSLNNFAHIGSLDVLSGDGPMSAYINGQPQPIPTAMTPFPELSSYDDHFSVFTSITYPYQETMQLHTANQAFNGGDDRREAMASDYWYLAGAAGPFDGGKGVAAAVSCSVNYGSRPSYGGGSGAVLTSCSAGKTHPARGASGMVLIFPTSMG